MVDQGQNSYLNFFYDIVGADVSILILRGAEQRLLLSLSEFGRYFSA